MFQVVAVYAVTAWLIVEVITSIEEPLSLPSWSDTLVIVLLALGFPIMLIVSWLFNVTPDGLIRDSGTSKAAPRAGPRMEWILLGIVGIAVAWLFYRTEFDHPAPPEEPSPTAVTQSALPNSIAVLPFENISLEPDDAYFAAGLHEEILSRLAKLRNLKVISRTSVRHYADSELTIPEIAKELNVGSIMEGGVQYADGRVRIHAQLIDATTDQHIWSETYDREFSDIFAIESDIAANIANALRIELSLSERESLERAPDASVDAHLLYLGATPPSGAPPQSGPRPQGGPPQRHQSDDARLDRLDRTIQAAPNFALPYIERAGIYVQSLRTPGAVTSLLDRREELEALALADLNRALEIDPTLGLAYSWLGMIHRYNWRGAEAKAAFEQALELSPNDSDVLVQYGYFLSNTGQNEQAIRMAERALELDPHNPETHAALGQFHAAAGKYEAAADSFGAAGQRGAAWVLPLAANIEILRGNELEAARHLHASEPMAMTVESPQWPALTAYTYARLKLDKDAERLLARFDQLAADQRAPAAAAIMAHLARGEEPEALDRLIGASRDQTPYEAFNLLMGIAANVYRDPVLDEPEFAAARQNLGFNAD
jgi:TolB-like protein/Tfp pilus assembly protein PilF